jgi:hypothetical protein
MHCYRVAAEAGNLEAQRLLAWNCLNGHGVARDAAAAALWFRKAPEQGMPARNSNWPRCIAPAPASSVTSPRRSNGTVARPSRATAYAQYNLAVMLLKGQGTTQDAEEAFPLVLSGGRTRFGRSAAPSG